MSEVTAPIMTDATGQSIDGKLNSLLGKMDNLAAAFQPNASGIVYSNTTSGLTGDDVQEAIDEMAADVSEIKQSLVNYVIRYITWNNSPSSYQNGAYYYHTYNSDISKSNYDIVSIYIKNSKWKMPLFAIEEDDDTSTTYKIRLEYAKSDFPNVNDLASSDRQWIVIGYVPKKFN